MLVTCQRFGDWFLFGLVWQYSSIQKNIMKVGSKPRLLTCISNITLSLHSHPGSALKRELNVCNSYLSLLYFWAYSTLLPVYISLGQSIVLKRFRCTLWSQWLCKTEKLQKIAPENEKFVESYLKIRQSKINSRWVAGPIGQTNRWLSVWCSKYYFF